MLRKLMIAAGLAAAMTSTVQAAETCTGQDELLDHFEKVYAETPVAAGLGADGKLFVVLASQSGTWSIMLADPAGTGCIVATGENWQPITAKAAGPQA
jgi:hypothetical protein